MKNSVQYHFQANKKNKILTIVICITIVYVFYYIIPFVTDYENRKQFNQRIGEIGGNQIISLNDLTPFQWDSLYAFGPYTSVGTMAEIMGVERWLIRRSWNEGQLNMYFIKDNRIVCRINGCPTNLDYFFLFRRPNTGTLFDDNALFVKIDSNDNPKFYIDTTGEFTRLTLSDIR